MSAGVVKERIAKWVAGDIVLSDKPGEAIKRWRDIFNISQTSLASILKVSPSVISDYEKGRRKSPGAGSVKRIVEAFISIDDKRGGKSLLAFTNIFGTELPPDVVLEMKEFREPMSGKALCKAVEGEAVANEGLLGKKLFGYTVIDSYKAVLGLSSDEFRRLYGMSTERALIFTSVTTGRSPMVAIKAIGMTPGMVVLHGGLKQVDPLGIKIAELLHVPLVLSHSPSVESLLEGLRTASV